MKLKTGGQDETHKVLVTKKAELDTGLEIWKTYRDKVFMSSEDRAWRKDINMKAEEPGVYTMEVSAELAESGPKVADEVRVQVRGPDAKREPKLRELGLIPSGVTPDTPTVVKFTCRVTYARPEKLVLEEIDIAKDVTTKPGYLRNDVAKMADLTAGDGIYSGKFEVPRA